jgi:hypothetical protein
MTGFPAALLFWVLGAGERSGERRPGREVGPDGTDGTGEIWRGRGGDGRQQETVSPSYFVLLWMLLRVKRKGTGSLSLKIQEHVDVCFSD